MDKEKLNKTQDIIDTPTEIEVYEAELITEEPEEKEVFILADTLPELDEEENEEEVSSNSESA